MSGSPRTSSGASPTTVHVGMKVAVEFEQQDDVWFPLFAPTGDPEPGPAARPRTRPSGAPGRWRRPTSSRTRSRSRGSACREVGRRLMRDPLALTVEAVRARHRRRRPRAATTSTGSRRTRAAAPAPAGTRRAASPRWRTRCGCARRGSAAAPETPGQSGSIVNAMLAVASGLCRHVLCFRTVWESTHAELQRQGRGAPRWPGGRIGGDMQWRIPYGALSAANWIAMNASLHIHRYGTTARDARLDRAERAHERGAQSRRRSTANRSRWTTTSSARMITTPFGLYDCDVPCDGSVAVIVSRRRRRRAICAKPPVLVEAVGTQITEPVSWDQGTLEHEPMLAGPGAHLWTRTDAQPADVDVALLYDGFTFNCLSWIEALGFCGMRRRQGLRRRRYAHRARRRAAAQPARRPALGRAHPRLRLRARGGRRSSAATPAIARSQGARLAVVSTGGGTPGGCFLLRSE